LTWTSSTRLIPGFLGTSTGLRLAMARQA